MMLVVRTLRQHRIHVLLRALLAVLQLGRHVESKVCKQGKRDQGRSWLALFITT